MMTQYTFEQFLFQQVEQNRQEKGPILDWHQLYGILTEEMAELLDQIRLREEDREPMSMLEELVDIAAACQNAAEDMIGIRPLLTQKEQDRVDNEQINEMKNILSRIYMDLINNAKWEDGLQKGRKVLNVKLAPGILDEIRGVVSQ